MKYASLLLSAFICTSTIAQPPDDDVVVSRVLFGSCIQQDRPTSIFQTMKGFPSELILFTGDNIYADTADMKQMRAKYETLAANRSFQDLIADRKVMATWDDHDFGVNDSGADFPKRAQSQQEFLDFWRVPKDSPRRSREGVFNSQVFGPEGKRLQVICLDTRYFRSPLKKGQRRVGGPYYPDDSVDKTMLGETQWKWLAEQLRKPAEVRLVVSSIQFVASAAGQECWANLPHERNRMLDLLADTKANGVFFISGDRHWSEMSMVKEDVPYPIYDLTCSSLNQLHARGTPTENSFRSIEATYHRENFGTLVIDWTDNVPVLTLSIRDMEGGIRLLQTIWTSELQSSRK